MRNSSLPVLARAVFSPKCVSVEENRRAQADRMIGACVIHLSRRGFAVRIYARLRPRKAALSEQLIMCAVRDPVLQLEARASYLIALRTMKHLLIFLGRLPDLALLEEEPNEDQRLYSGSSGDRARFSRTERNSAAKPHARPARQHNGSSCWHDGAAEHRRSEGDADRRFTRGRGCPGATRRLGRRRTGRNSSARYRGRTSPAIR